MGSVSVQSISSSELVLPARLTQAEAVAALESLRKAAMRVAHPEGWVVVDASALRSFDSAALAVLLELRRWTLQQRCRLQVQGAPKALQRLAQLYGVSTLIGWPDVDPDRDAVSDPGDTVL